MSATEEGQQQIIHLLGGLATAQEAIRSDVKSLKEENARFIAKIGELDARLCQFSEALSGLMARVGALEARGILIDDDPSSDPSFRTPRKNRGFLGVTPSLQLPVPGPPARRLRAQAPFARLRLLQRWWLCFGGLCC